MDSEVIHIPNLARETELQPANLANQGKTTKETAGLMDLSTDPALYQNLVRFAHNWNIGILELWNNGLWENGKMGELVLDKVRDWQNSS